MPSVTFDGRSFLLDGKRIWIVSGSIHPNRVPRADWADRIHAAKSAGLNTIEVPICWARHEPRPGTLDFDGENDIRHFVELIDRADMWCILRPGPYIGDGWDLGGIPPWVLEIPNVKLRTNNSPFLEACSRYIGAVAERLRGLQVTSPGAGGPILLVQNEREWNCGQDAIALGYLGELNRYLREGGITVPIINSNNLWQSVEGEIDGWVGDGTMLQSLRQLAVVRPDQPRLVVDFVLGEQPVWGLEQHDPSYIRGGIAAEPGPWETQRRLAESVAGAGQFNLQPFAGGANYGFTAGRLPEGPAVFVGHSNQRRGIITESGAPSPAFHAVRRITTFSSCFGRVLSNLDASFQPVAIDPTVKTPDAARSAKGAKSGSASLSIVHAMGSQGGVVFVFAPETGDESHHAAPRSAPLLLPDGSNLTAYLGQQSVAWCLLDAPLGGRASLDYCSLCAFGLVGKVFVCFGPAGVRGSLAINGSGFEVTVPTGKSPVIEEHEGITVVVCNEEQIDTAFLTDDAVFVGVAGVTADGKPIPLNGSKNCTRITADGVSSTVAIDAPKAHHVTEKVHVGAWSFATMDDYVDGTSARFATIKGPADLTSLGAPYGYGWYRVTTRSASTHKAKLAFPHAGDRVHVFADGHHLGVVGVGAGTTRTLSLPMKKPASAAVFLAGNCGRFSAGDALGERKGLFGHAWEVEPVKFTKPKIVEEDPIDILSFRAPIWDVREGDTTAHPRITWTIQHRKKSSLLISLRDEKGRGFMGRALLLLDSKPIEVLEFGTPDQILIDGEHLAKGNHTISVAMFPDSLDDQFHGDIEAAAEALHSVIDFHEAVEPATLKAEWAFAKWEPPSPSLYKPAPKSLSRDLPTWWRCSFDHPNAVSPLVIELAGLTCGQVYVNGRHLGRYFLRRGETDRMLAPAAWLRPGKDNDLVIFDEHGASPAKVHLANDTSHVLARA
jgi:Glycosyl hydrolases family 35